MVTAILLFLTGIVMGAMNAIAGGGGLIGFPVMLLAGLNPLVANITSNIVVLPGQLTAAYEYRKYIRKVPRRYLLLLIPCFVGGVLGALFLRHTSSNDFERMAPALILFAVVLFTVQPFLKHDLHRHIKGRKRNLRPILLIALALLPTAMYGGFFGPGFGFIMLAFLSFTSLHDFHQMNGLKNLGAVCIITASIACLLSTGLINWRVGLVMAGGNALGGYLGARYSQRVSSHSLHIFVSAVGFCAALVMAVKVY